jgi:hypothetical protein
VGALVAGSAGILSGHCPCGRQPDKRDFGLPDAARQERAVGAHEAVSAMGVAGQVSERAFRLSGALRRASSPFTVHPGGEARWVTRFAGS